VRRRESRECRIGWNPPPLAADCPEDDQYEAGDARSRQVDDEWKEFDRLLDLTWGRVLSSGRAISPYAVTEAELAQSDKPYLVRARQEGRDVTW
jgi:hypothetical protein